MQNVLLMLYYVLSSFIPITGVWNTDIGHQYYWRDYRGFIPNDAFPAVDNLYVAQIVNYWQIPGTFDPRTGEASTGRINKVTVDDHFKLLCDRNVENFIWQKVHSFQLSGSKLDDLVIGGYEQNSTVYIGKVFHEGQWKIGKVFPPTSEFRGFRTWTETSERYVTDTFEVLVYDDRPDVERVCDCRVQRVF